MGEEPKPTGSDDAIMVSAPLPSRPGSRFRLRHSLAARITALVLLVLLGAVASAAVALDQLRARKREVLFEPSDLEREIDAAEGDSRDAELIEQHDLSVARRRVEVVLGRINPRYASAIRLRVLEQRPRDEAAAELGVSVSTFDVVLHRAMAALKKALAATGDNEA